MNGKQWDVIKHEMCGLPKYHCMFLYQSPLPVRNVFGSHLRKEKLLRGHQWE